MNTRGRFITFEGPDGCGKSTLAKIVTEALRKKVSCSLESEPTKAPIGSVIRKHLIDNDLSPQTFLFLFLADRYEHLQSVIQPKLKASHWFFLDRYMDSTWAYQSAHCKIDVRELKRWTEKFDWFLKPDRTYLLHLSYDEMMFRIKNRKTFEANDRAGKVFYEDVASRFKALQEEDPDRIKLLDANVPVKELAKIVLEDLTSWM